MTDETKLARSANHVYREGYDQGKEDAFDQTDEFIDEVCKGLRDNFEDMEDLEDIIGFICDECQEWQNRR